MAKLLFGGVNFDRIYAPFGSKATVEVITHHLDLFASVCPFLNVSMPMNICRLEQLVDSLAKHILQYGADAYVVDDGVFHRLGALSTICHYLQ